MCIEVDLIFGYDFAESRNITECITYYSQLQSYMACNNTCCGYDDDGEPKVICFDDKNFTTYQDLEETPQWELGVRWGLIVPLLVFFGVGGNVSIIVILFKNRLLMKTTVNHFILNMAVSDLILACAGPIPFTIRDTNQFWVLGELWCHLDGFIQVTVMLVSVLSLCTISIDRLLGILYLLHRHLKNWHCNLIIIAIWIISLTCAVPFYIFRNYGVREWADVTEIYCDEVYDKTFICWLVIIIVLNWIPLTVMIFCYTKLFLGIKKHAKRNEKRGHPGLFNVKKRFVKMLFAMIIVFTLCWLPFQLFIIFNEHLISKNDSKANESDELYNIAFTLMQYIVYLNPAINPFIYGLMHDNFRKGFRVTFKCFFKEKPDLVLVPSYGGSQPYAWSHRSVLRHTLPSSNSKSKKTKNQPQDPEKQQNHLQTSGKPEVRRTSSLDRVLVPIYGGSQPYTWSHRSMIRHTVPSSNNKSKKTKNQPQEPEKQQNHLQTSGKPELIRTSSVTCVIRL